MDLLRRFVDIFLHLDTHLSQVIAQYGPDSAAVQLLGLKRKSERRRPVRRSAAAA